MKLKNLLYSLAATMVSGMAVAQTTVFDTNSSNCYRIPAITKDANGNLIAVSDLRYSSYGDIGNGNRIDIVYKTSSDNGASWSSQQTMISGGGSGFDFAHGDAAIVTDRESGKMLVMCASGTYSCWNSRVSVSRSGSLMNWVYSLNFDKAQRVGRAYSNDNGATWTTCTDISDKIYGLYNTASRSTYYNNSDFIDGVFFGSGRICQSKYIKKAGAGYYRIYAALWSQKEGSLNGNLVIYSDDFGETWSKLGTANEAAPQGDEPKIEELPDGSVLLSSRMNGGRYFNIFKYTDTETAEGSWSTPVASTSTGGTVATGNSTNGEILIVPAKRASDNKDVYVVLQSVPFGSDRSNVGIYYKVLASKDDFVAPSNFVSGWTAYPISKTTSCYSTMVLDKDGNVAFLYEENLADNNGYDIQFQSLSLETITGGAYSYNANLDNDAWLDNDGKLARVFTIKNKMTDPETNEVTYRYIYMGKDTNGKPSMKCVLADEVTELDNRYYWVLNQDPDQASYYISSFSGEGYIGEADGTDYSDITKTGKIVNCTDDYTKQFDIDSFDKIFAVSGQTGDEMEGFALEFTRKYDDGTTGQRVISMSDQGEFNWFDHSDSGTRETQQGIDLWSTDFIFTEVAYTEATSSTPNYGTKDNPTHSGFPVKFGRHADSYNPIEGLEDWNMYATLKLPFATYLPEGVTAYQINSLNPNPNKEKVNLTELTNLETTSKGLKILPAKLPSCLQKPEPKAMAKRLRHCSSCLPWHRTFKRQASWEHWASAHSQQKTLTTQ